MKIFRSISVLLLSVLVLVSSTSFMVGMHFCMGDLVNIGVLSHAPECDMERDLPPCHRQLKAACCENEQVVHHADDIKSSVVKVEMPHLMAQPTPTFSVLISTIIPAVVSLTTANPDYDPPFPRFDIIVEHHSLLI